MKKILFILIFILSFILGQNCPDGTGFDDDNLCIEGKFITEELEVLGGVPGVGKVLTDDGAGIGIAVWAIGLTDPMTTRGDIIIRNAANATARLGIGANTFVLTSDGIDPSWVAFAGGGATTALDNLASVAINQPLLLGTSDAHALGSATKMWSDLFLADGGVINWNNGDVTLTHGANLLTLAGGNLSLGTGNITTTGIGTFGNLLSNSNYVLEGYSTGRVVHRTQFLRIFPGAIPNTNMNVSITNTTGDTHNASSLTAATDLAAGGTEGSFTLSADGKDLTMVLTETVIAVLSVTLMIMDVDSGLTGGQTIAGKATGGNVRLRIYKSGNVTVQSWLDYTDTGDFGAYFLVEYLTST